MKKILVLFVLLQTFLFADFKSISADELKNMMAQGVPVIDIRTPSEWKETGIIPGSKKIMFFDEKGNYDALKFMGKIAKFVKDENQPFILVCRSGSRTKTVGSFLSRDMGYKRVYDLADGIVYNWIKKGKQVSY
jgi:rhodanese-related sulfurtransferase